MKKNAEDLERRQSDLREYVKSQAEKGICTTEAIRKFAKKHYYTERSAFNDFTAESKGDNHY